MKSSVYRLLYVSAVLLVGLTAGGICRAQEPDRDDKLGLPRYTVRKERPVPPPLERTEIDGNGDTVTVYYYLPHDYGTLGKGPDGKSSEPSTGKEERNRDRDTSRIAFRGPDPQQYDFGEIAFTEDVSALGGRTVTVPIFDSAVTGSTPSLSLVYNSHGGDGVAGWGWSIGGLSSITVSPRSLYYDGVASPATPDRPDSAVFSLDGVRLIARQTSTGTLPAYTLETSQGNTFVKKVMSGSEISRFLTASPDGTKAGYGTESNDSTRLVYPLDFYFDIHGYRVDYEYVSSGGSYYVTSVKYGGYQRNTHPCRIDFSYESRQDLPLQYSSGRGIRLTKLLKQVACIDGTDTLRVYTLTHTVNASDGTVRLERIDCRNGEGHSLCPLTFDYDITDDPGMQTVRALEKDNGHTISSDFNTSPYPNLYVRGKFFDSRYEDGLLIYPGMPTYGIVEQYGNKKKYGSPYPEDQDILVSPYVVKYQTSSNEYVGLQAGRGFQDVRAVDIDGDGKDEIVRVNILSAGYFGIVLSWTAWDVGMTSSEMTVCRSDTTFLSGRIYSSQIYSPMSRSYYYGDFDGDGKAELLTLCHSKSPYNLTGTSYTALIDLDSETVSGEWTTPFDFPYSDARYVFAMDFDGDGVTDLCHAKSSSLDVYDLSSGTMVLKYADIPVPSTVFKGKYSMGDINGDGLADIAGPLAQSGWYETWTYVPIWAPEYCPSCGGENPITDVEGTTCRHCGTNLKYAYMHGYNTPCCRTCGGPLTAYFNSPDEDPLYPYGCADHGTTAYINYSYYYDAGTRWNVLLNTGRTFTRSIHTVCHHGPDDDLMLYDVDNDGLADLVRSSGGKVTVYRNVGGEISPSDTLGPVTFASDMALMPLNSSNPSFPSSLMGVQGSSLHLLWCSYDRKEENLLRWMSDSRGNVHGTYYSKMTGGGTFSQDTSAVQYPYAKMVLPLDMVYETLVKTSSGWYLQQSDYRYEGLYIHQRGLGLCGMGRMKVHDAKTGVVSVTTFDPTMFGAPVKVETYVPQGTWYGTPSNTDRIATAEMQYSLNQVSGTGKTNPRLVQKEETGHLDGTHTRMTFSYDPHGNVSGRNIYHGSDLWSSSAATYIDYSISDRFCWTLPTTEEETLSGGSGGSWKNRKTHSYNTSGLVTGESSYTGTSGTSLVSARTFTYDNWCNPLSETTKMYGATTGTTKSYTWSSDGRRMVTATDERGQTTSYGNFDAYGSPGTITQVQSGAVSTLQYDTWGLVTGGTRPDSTSFSRTRAKVSGGGWTETETSSNGPGKIVRYDSMGRKVKVSTERSDGSWAHTDTEYDSAGRVSRTSDPYTGQGASQWTVWTYDRFGRPLSAVEPSGRTTSWMYSPNVTVVTSDGITTMTNVNQAGQTTSVTDSGGTITYAYRSDGNPYTVTAPGDLVTSFGYDAYGRRTSITDPSAGTTTWSYSTASDGTTTLTETDARNHATTKVYNVLGDLTSLSHSGVTASYTYDSHGRLTGVSNSDGSSTRTFAYDSLGRMTRSVETVIDNVSLQTDYTYSGGMMRKRKFTTGDGLEATEHYSYGHGIHTGTRLTSTALQDTALVWLLLGENDFGQPTSIQSGNTVRTYTYDSRGLPTGRKAGTFQNFGYSFNPLTGNLTSRTDSTRSITETFGYDQLNRLTQVNGATVVTYNGYGGIATKTGVGTYTYGTPTNSVSYRIREVNGPDSLATAAGSSGRSINYGTPSGKAYYILKDGKLTAFDYDEDGNRVRMRTGTGVNDVWTSLHYVGNRYEYDTVTGAGRLWLDGDAYSAPAVLVRSTGGTWQLCYIYRDYLGSITHVTDATGTVLEENSYDPWGRMRDPATQVCYASGSEPSLMLGRGYTGHEWLPLAGLLNMNARFYDPVIGVFLAPDPYVQAPSFTQNFNRYAYALNNPLRYTDESGEFIITTPMIVAAGIGAAVGLVSGYYIGKQHGATGWAMFGYMVGGGLIGGLSGFAGGCVSGALAHISGAGFVGGALSGGASAAAAGFISGSGFSMLNGYSLSQSLLNGVKSAGIGFLVGGALGGMAQGISDLRHGGNFWTGKGAIEEFSGGVLSEDLKVKLGEGMEYSNEYAHSFSNRHFSKWEKFVSKLYADGTIPEGHGYEMYGDYVINKKGGIVFGAFVKGEFGQGGDVYLFKVAFTSKEQLYLTMGHEYLHAAFFASSSYTISSLDERHAVIYHWCYEQAKAFNVDYATILRYKNAASELAYWMPLNPFMSIVEDFGIFHVPPGLL